MTVLIAGLVLFLGVHSISIVAPAWRDASAARVGVPAWKGIYSLLAIAGFVLLIWGYGLARLEPTVLYTPPVWTRWLSAVLMLPVFPLLLAPYLPGKIRATTKHPMLLAVEFWALAHLISNGTLADVILFGGFLLWAVLDRISYKHRTQRSIPSANASRFNDAIALGFGLILYFVFMHALHARWIGVSPLPA